MQAPLACSSAWITRWSCRRFCTSPSARPSDRASSSSPSPTSTRSSLRHLPQSLKVILGAGGKRPSRADMIDGGKRPREGRTEGEQSRHDRRRRKETEGETDIPGLLGTSSPLLYSPLTAVSSISSITMRYTEFDRIRAGLVVPGPAAPPGRPIAECSVLALAGGYIIAGGGLITVHDN